MMIHSVPFSLEGFGCATSRKVVGSITYDSGIVLVTFSVLEWCYEIVLWTLHYLPMLWLCAHKEVQE